MKTLVLLYGHYRTFDKTYTSWINALEGSDYDCRFITFDTIEHTTKCWWRDRVNNSVKLTDTQIELLRKFDKNTRILKQEYTEEEINDIYATLPFKVYMYKYYNIKDVLENIDETQYDKIIISRFDIELYNIKFKDISIEKDEIKIGYDNMLHFHKGISCSDTLYMFNPKDKNKFYEIPNGILNRKFSIPEAAYTDFFYEKFNIVTLAWKICKDYTILRP
jgi:hypothetical protein